MRSASTTTALKKRQLDRSLRDRGFPAGNLPQSLPRDTWHNGNLDSLCVHSTNTIANQVLIYRQTDRNHSKTLVRHPIIKRVEKLVAVCQLLKLETFGLYLGIPT